MSAADGSRLAVYQGSAARRSSMSGRRPGQVSEETGLRSAAIQAGVEPIASSAPAVFSCPSELASAWRALRQAASIPVPRSGGLRSIRRPARAGRRRSSSWSPCSAAPGVIGPDLPLYLAGRVEAPGESLASRAVTTWACWAYRGSVEQHEDGAATLADLLGGASTAAEPFHDIVRLLCHQAGLR